MGIIGKPLLNFDDILGGKSLDINATRKTGKIHVGPNKN